MALNIEGTVTSVGLRTTQIKAVDGTVHFIPNRNITTISNLSRANMQVLIDVRINPEEGYEKICEVITEVNETLKEKYIESIQTGPDIFGMVDLGNGNFAVRTTMYVLNGKQFAVKEEFLAQYIKALTEAGFTIPNTPIIAKYKKATRYLLVIRCLLKLNCCLFAHVFNKIRGTCWLIHYR